jgi:hypothetical protein
VWDKSSVRSCRDSGAEQEESEGSVRAGATRRRRGRREVRYFILRRGAERGNERLLGKSESEEGKVDREPKVSGNQSCFETRVKLVR